jgi:peptidoglycan/xylan/chitin deacetylase (PgdA/CDA1 family)
MSGPFACTIVHRRILFCRGATVEVSKDFTAFVGLHERSASRAALKEVLIAWGREGQTMLKISGEVDSRSTSQSYSLPVLTLHSVDNQPDDQYTITPDEFRDLVRLLSSEFRPRTLASIIDDIKNGRTADPRDVLITFDDGYQNNYLHARPILLEQGVSAVFFILPAMLGQYNLWDHPATYIHPHMTSQEVQSLAADGFEIGSHGLTHHNLIKFGRARIYQELKESRTSLERLLEREITAFSYPFGFYSSMVLQEAEKVYDIAFAIDNSSSDWFKHRLLAVRRESIWPHMTKDQIRGAIARYNSDCDKVNEKIDTGVRSRSREDHSPGEPLATENP